jgi:hypothetical protein
MNPEERKTLDIVMREFLNSLLGIYESKDSDNRDLCMDAVMMWLYENFGRGEILEYISIGMESMSDPDYRQAAEHLRNAIDSIPEASEFNLFDENMPKSYTQAFKKVWHVAKDNELAALELIQKFVRENNNFRAHRVGNDMLQIIIAKRYEIDEDLETLRKKYNI